MQAKFRGWQVLRYFAWTIIRGKVRNLQNISRVKVNTPKNILRDTSPIIGEVSLEM